MRPEGRSQGGTAASRVFLLRFPRRSVLEGLAARSVCLREPIVQRMSRDLSVTCTVLFRAVLGQGPSFLTMTCYPIVRKYPQKRAVTL